MFLYARKCKFQAEAVQPEWLQKGYFTMKKIINGKKYDTETARECFQYQHGNTYVDREHAYTEVLYRKRTGEFFLHGWGGRLSKYGRLDERRCLYSVEEILPMSETEAKVWAECHMDGDEYETLFGEVEE